MYIAHINLRKFYHFLDMIVRNLINAQSITPYNFPSKLRDLIFKKWPHLDLLNLSTYFSCLNSLSSSDVNSINIYQSQQILLIHHIKLLAVDPKTLVAD